jgi:tetratricopeptide (TPR) repeat protein
MKKLALLILLITSSVSAFSYYELDASLKSAYSSIMNLELEKAEQLLQKEKIEKPGNDMVALYVNYTFFMKAFISEEEVEFEKFKKQSALTLKQMEKKEENNTSPWHSYAKAEIMIQQALVKVKFREYVSAATEIRKAYKLIDRNKLLFPGFPLNNKLSGFLNVVVGAVPREYHWLVEVAGMDGSTAVGTQELKSLFDACTKTDYDCYKEEILFYLTNIYTTFNSTDRELEECLVMLKPYSNDSPLMRYCSASILIKLGKNDEAIAAMGDLSGGAKSYPFYFLYYKMGVCKMRKLDLSATNDFLEFLKKYKGQNYIKSSYQKLAWLELLKNNTPGFYDYMSKCKLNGSAFIDEDKEALHEASIGELSNRLLLRARLLFDGGYFSLALNELSGKSLDNFPKYRDQLEVTYRLARIYQKQGDLAKAIGLFEKTIANGSNATYYFAANSALLLGMHYEDVKEYDRAESYYKKCLSLEAHEYQNSIDQKAQAGLDRLKFARSEQ